MLINPEKNLLVCFSRDKFSRQQALYALYALKSNMEDLTSSETGVKPEVYMYH